MYPELLGAWSGTVRTFDGEEIEVQTEFRPQQDIHIRVGSQLATIVDNPRLLPEGVFVGRFSSSLPNDEGLGFDHMIRVNLLFDGDAATGYFASNFDTERGTFDLPSFVRLERRDSSRPGHDEAARP
jgi:hypothetical protein